jgi:hypothetical protein
VIDEQRAFLPRDPRYLISQYEVNEALLAFVNARPERFRFGPRAHVNFNWHVEAWQGHVTDLYVAVTFTGPRSPPPKKRVYMETQKQIETFPVSEFKPGIYEHYKGDRYQALFLAEHHETRQPFVTYLSLSKGTINLRPWHSLTDDAWTDLVREQVPDGAEPHPWRPRFKYLEKP